MLYIFAVGSRVHDVIPVIVWKITRKLSWHIHRKAPKPRANRSIYNTSGRFLFIAPAAVYNKRYFATPACRHDMMEASLIL